MHGHRYPTWRLIACDYLAIMVSSVASERAFSSAGITICKRCNRLDGDIVEALQCLKSLIQQDLMLSVYLSVADEETQLDEADNQPTNQQGSASEAVQGVEDWIWGAVVEEVGSDGDADGVVVIE
jgi:hypothetical protein